MENLQKIILANYRENSLGISSFLGIGKLFGFFFGWVFDGW
jgi:hypothetical protein